VSRGIHVTAVAPTGYQKADNGRLELDPAAAPIIREVFNMRVAGKSWPEITTYMNTNGLVGPHGTTNWYRATAAKITANRVYLGEARSGEFVNPEAHEPIIDKATFEAAQRITAPTPARSQSPSLLSGIIRCAGCRYAMRPDSQTQKGKKIRQYSCHKQHSVGTCSEPSSILAVRIENYVLEDFFSSIEKPKVTVIDDDLALAKATEALEMAQAELAAFRDDERILGALGQDGFVKGLEKRAAAVTGAADALARIRSNRTEVDSAHIEDVWDTLSIEDQQELLRSAVGAVFIRKGRMPVADRAVILSPSELPAGLPSRGKRVPIAPFAE
jgi:hypothetical protein